LQQADEKQKMERRIPSRHSRAVHQVMYFVGYVYIVEYLSLQIIE